MTLSANLIEHYEQDQDLKLTKSQKRQQRRFHKKRPIPGSVRFANPNRSFSLTDRVLNPDFHEKFIAGKPGTFEDLIMFLRDQTKDRQTIGLKNYYLKFLKNHAFTPEQAETDHHLKPWLTKLSSPPSAEPTFPRQTP
ncbi:MAG: hypothetical protein ACJA16_005381 [Akkermansiaceae bacterium]|jgi:hypothetical protein